MEKTIQIKTYQFIWFHIVLIKFYFKVGIQTNAKFSV